MALGLPLFRSQEGKEEGTRGWRTVREVEGEQRDGKTEGSVKRGK